MRISYNVKKLIKTIVIEIMQIFNLNFQSTFDFEYFMNLIEKF